MSNKTPAANVPNQGPDEPRGDRGHGDKTWSPEQGEQGISNRVGDEDPTAARDGESFGYEGEDVVSMAEEDPGEDEDADEDEDEDEDDDFGDDDEEEDEEEDQEEAS